MGNLDLDVTVNEVFSILGNTQATEFERSLQAGQRIVELDRDWKAYIEKCGG